MTDSNDQSGAIPDCRQSLGLWWKLPWLPTSSPIHERAISVPSLSSSFPRDIILSQGHCLPNRHKQTVSCMTVYMGKGCERNLRLWYTVTPNPKGEGVPGNWASAETQEFKKSKKVNVSLHHRSESYWQWIRGKIIAITYTFLSKMFSS